MKAKLHNYSSLLQLPFQNQMSEWKWDNQREVGYDLSCKVNHALLLFLDQYQDQDLGNKLKKIQDLLCIMDKHFEVIEALLLKPVLEKVIDIMLTPETAAISQIATQVCFSMVIEESNLYEFMISNCLHIQLLPLIYNQNPIISSNMIKIINSLTVNYPGQIQVLQWYNLSSILSDIINNHDDSEVILTSFLTYFNINNGRCRDYLQMRDILIRVWRLFEKHYIEQPLAIGYFFIFLCEVSTMQIHHNYLQNMGLRLNSKQLMSAALKNLNRSLLLMGSLRYLELTFSYNADEILQYMINRCSILNVFAELLNDSNEAVRKIVCDILMIAAKQDCGWDLVYHPTLFDRLRGMLNKRQSIRVKSSIYKLMAELSSTLDQNGNHGCQFQFCSDIFDSAVTSILQSDDEDYLITALDFLLKAFERGSSISLYSTEFTARLQALINSPLTAINYESLALLKLING